MTQTFSYECGHTFTKDISSIAPVARIQTEEAEKEAQRLCGPCRIAVPTPTVEPIAPTNCGAGEHHWTDGRCLFCRTYEPMKERVIHPMTDEEIEVEEHLARMNRMMDSGDSVY